MGPPASKARRCVLGVKRFSTGDSPLLRAEVAHRSECLSEMKRLAYLPHSVNGTRRTETAWDRNECVVSVPSINHQVARNVLGVAPATSAA